MLCREPGEKKEGKRRESGWEGAINFIFSEKENAKGEKSKGKKEAHSLVLDQVQTEDSCLVLLETFFVPAQPLFMFAAQAGPLVAREVLYCPPCLFSTGLWKFQSFVNKLFHILNLQCALPVFS